MKGPRLFHLFTNIYKLYLSIKLNFLNVKFFIKKTDAPLGLLIFYEKMIFKLKLKKKSLDYDLYSIKHMKYNRFY